ncbi:trimeric LpxA-like protein [Meredithblackwellia eburnea MCA 4105]
MSSMTISPTQNRARMLNGQLYHAFVPDLIRDRNTAKKLCDIYNRTAPESTRRQALITLKQIIPSIPSLPPPPTASPDSTPQDEAAADEELLSAFPYVEPPFRCDYGLQVEIGMGTFINFNCTILDTCRVSIGERCLLGPSISLYSASHPLNPNIRNGTQGPENGGEIIIQDDVWIGGSVVVVARPAARIVLGRGCVVGAGSLVYSSALGAHSKEKLFSGFHQSTVLHHHVQVCSNG